MIFDRVRFITSEKCQYGNFTLFFGVLDGEEKEGWYMVDPEENIFKMVRSTAKKTAALRVPGPSATLFYIPKIEKLRKEYRASMKVNKERKIEKT